MEFEEIGEVLTMNSLKHRLYRSVNSKLAGFYQYVHLIFGTNTYEPASPLPCTVNTAKELFRILEMRFKNSGLESTQGLREAKAALKQCDDLESLLHVTNEDGFHLLQMAVMCADRCFLELLVNEGCNLNAGKCTLPLHLACVTGELGLVCYLLDQGADRHLERGMCYPRAHHPVRHVPSRFHFLETNIYRCDSNHQLPLMFAIQHDHLDIVRHLLQGEYGYAQTLPFRRLPLHHACQHGALKCIKYLVTVNANDMNEMDGEGLTPLLHAAPWGKPYVQLLEEAGANVRLVSNKSRNALHVLYSKAVNPLDIHETSRFLLGTGLEEDTCGQDDHGYTALHELISLVNRRVETFKQNNDMSQQSEFDQQVIQTMELLLRNNCDSNILNNGGVTALHKLILLFDYITSNEMTGMPLGSLPSREHYKVDFDMLHQAMSVLLRQGATANLPSAAGRTPLIMLLQCVLNVDPARVGEYSAGFLRCLALLCREGAQPSSTLAVHINMVTTLTKLGQKCLATRDPEAKQHVSAFLMHVLALLCQHGLNSNYCSLRRKSRAEGASGNILFEMVKLSQYIRQPSDLDLIYNWVLTALQWGANPDMEPFPSDPIIYQSHSSIFLKNKGTQPVNAFMYEMQDFRQIFEGGYAEKLLTLFINSMDHDALYQGLNSAKVMSRFDPNRSPTFNFIQLVNNFSSQPRSLKQISRVAIYQAIDRQLKLRVPHLPLPKLIQDYLIQVQ